MSLPLAQALLTLTLLAAPPPQPPPTEDCKPAHARPIELEAKPCARRPEVRVGEGVATVLVFDSPLKGVETPATASFARVAVDQGVLTLLPGERLAEVEGVSLTVRFADEAAPTSATFQLVVVTPARAERQVEVFRHRRPVASFEREVRELEVENARLREENARLRAAQARPAGLAGLWLAGELGTEGVLALSLEGAVRQHVKNPLVLKTLSTFRANGGLLVAMELKNPAGAQPWRVEAAALVAPDGSVLRVAQVWQEAEIAPDEFGTALVMVEAETDMPPGPFTLTLWAQDGKRAVILGNITFP